MNTIKKVLQHKWVNDNPNFILKKFNVQQLEKQKELERRELGKNLQSFKEEQRQARLRRDIEERKRDKIQEQLVNFL